MDLGDMLMGAMARSAGGQRQRPPATPVAELVEKLRALEERYSEAVPFAEGDLVTVRADGVLRGAGQPHVVLEVRDEAEPYFDGKDQGTPKFGARHNMRVACEAAGALCAYWVEAWQFEAWTDEHQARLQAKEQADAQAA